MRRLLLVLIILLPLWSVAQENLKTIRTRSWQTQAYKVSIKDVENFIKWDSIPLNRYINVDPAMIFADNYVDITKLGTGYFILITALENKILAEVAFNSDIVLLTINNKDHLQLDVRDKKGLFINNAKVFVNDKEAIFNNDSKTYWVKQSKLEETKVKIFTASDSLIKILSLKDEL